MGQAGIYVGIDVAKAQVDVAVRPTGERWEVPRDAAGIPQLVAEMKTLGPSLVLLEATGGLELPLVAALAAEALPVVVVNPRQVRDFARATGKLAQTDARDAAVLAHFAEAIQPPVRPLRDAETQELNSRTARRQQVMTMLVSEKNRLGAATSAVRPRIAAHITWLEQDLNDLDQTTLTKAGDRCSGRVRCGGRRTTSGAPFPAWVSNSPSRCWPTCPSWAPLTVVRSPHWWAWLPATATAAPCGANGRSGADAPGSELSGTWGRWLPLASIPSSGTSTSGCWPPVSRRSWLWSLACASCSSSSTPCSSSAHPGGTSLRQSSLLPLDIKHSC